MSNPPSLLGSQRDNVYHSDIALHDHVCGIYDTRQEQYEPACKFLQIGLGRNERCAYIAEQLTPDAFISFMESQGVNAREATINGSLQVLSGKDVRLKLGGFTPEAMFSFLKECETRAHKDGFTAFRWAADMTWLRQDNIELAEMFAFEANLNRLLLKHDLTAFCQYSMDDFKSELLIAAAETHPLLVYNDVVCDNFYFMPPEEYFNPGSSDVKLKRLLANIVSRERLMTRFLAD